MTELDGNSLAGDLAEIFARDMTAARFTCGGCRHTGAVATLRVWTPAPGVVARCPRCGDVLLRLVHTGGSVLLTLGTTRLEVPR
ncbi:hypothetical protein GCM10010168_75530 [Actinoplanes ianthinogenes]|uniref:Uncharacterized protein n=1 Tax=Actinoplanes ianthinogenes TaxID=122358 RepID=A0ABM7LRI8_9ACTN|nr:DUF6510 family protein [Actinoplanes ianthinogenes]BCJ41865.1 hypothetical protein Aiant_25220 [Actinoplanes ianthinogenes]GGR45613.1 hypothetical protein GCM10010168_75530 [Actinoplanes ianthinogenes]